MTTINKQKFLTTFDKNTDISSFARKSNVSRTIRNSNRKLNERIETMFYDICYYIILNDDIISQELKNRKKIMILNCTYSPGELTCANNDILKNYIFQGNLMQNMKDINNSADNERFYHESEIVLIQPIFELPLCAIRCVYDSNLHNHNIKIYVQRIDVTHYCFLI